MSTLQPARTAAPSADGPPAIEVEDLSLRVGDRTLFADLSWSVHAGQLAVLRGESGTGKTSLLRCLLGFQEPSAGIVRLFGQPLTVRSVRALRARLAYLPQEPPLGVGTVEDLLRRPLAYRANAHIVWERAEAVALLERLRLEERLLGDQLAGLSGGERQRVALVAALLLRRSLLLVDEPTAALDDVSGAAVIDLLADLPGVAALAVSHSAALAAAADLLLSLDPPAEGGALRPVSP